MPKEIDEESRIWKWKFAGLSYELDAWFQAQIVLVKFFTRWSWKLCIWTIHFPFLDAKEAYSTFWLIKDRWESHIFWLGLFNTSDKKQVGCLPHHKKREGDEHVFEIINILIGDDRWVAWLVFKAIELYLLKGD